MRTTGHILLVSAALMLLAAAPAASKPSQELRKMENIRIWEGTPCHARGVTLTPYLPEGNGSAAAVIVCPGGSYFWLDEQTEGADVARWLQGEGIAAFVLRYRTAGSLDFWSGGRLIYGGHRHPDMICDIQRALQFVRENAAEYGINPTELGVMGFSAGGHLAMSAAEYFPTNFLARYGIEPAVSLRPDFCAAIYPVVTFTEDCTHARSRRGLLGEYRMGSRTLRDSLSLEKHIKGDTPPVFLLNCSDDPVVDYRNSELLDKALTEAGVQHLYTQFKEGGHGFGATSSKQGPETSLWQALFTDWMKETLKFCQSHESREPES